ncbi:MAG: hypothetical protein ACKV0T_30595 [Planctomycetales bacterium]
MTYYALASTASPLPDGPSAPLLSESGRRKRAIAKAMETVQAALNAARSQGERLASRPSPSGILSKAAVECLRNLQVLQQELETLKRGLDLVGDREGDDQEKQSGRRLTVTFHPDQAILDGRAFALSEQGAWFLDALVLANGNWVTGVEIAALHPDFDQGRVTRTKERLPAPILDLIESAPGRGSRLRTELKRR